MRLDYRTEKFQWGGTDLHGSRNAVSVDILQDEKWNTYYAS